MRKSLILLPVLLSTAPALAQPPAHQIPPQLTDPRMGDRLADIGEAAAIASLAGRDQRSESEHRNLFAGVVGAAPGGIGAVVAGNEEGVAVAQLRQRGGQPGIERPQRLGIARGIAAVTKVLVALDQIDEEQPIEGPHELIQRRRLRLGVGGGVVAEGEAVAGEEVLDLADADDLMPATFERVEQGRRGRWQ